MRLLFTRMKVIWPNFGHQISDTPNYCQRKFCMSYSLIIRVQSYKFRYQKTKQSKKISIETCSQKIYEQLQKSPPKTGLKYFRLYNAPNQKARIVPSLWSQRKLPSSYILRFHQTWHPMTISCLQNSNIIYLENDTTRQIPLDFEVISIWWRVWKMLQKVDRQVQKVYSGRWARTLKGRAS